MESPLVSVALCTYNGEKFLREQMDSILRQSYPNLEIIAVDDCSSDRTAGILHEYQRRHPAIRVTVNEYNLGFTGNFEKAIGLCSGEYICIADQDDVWHHEKVTSLVSAIGSAALVFHDSEFIDEKSQSLQLKMSDRFFMHKATSARNLLLETCVSGHAMLFSKKLKSVIFPFPKHFFYDQWIAMMAACNGGIRYLDFPYVRFRRHPDSSTDILRDRKKQRTPVRKKQQVMAKINEFTQRVPGCDADFMQLFSGLIEHTKTGIPAKIRLYLFLYRHRNELLGIQKKSFLSKCNYLNKLV